MTRTRTSCSCTGSRSERPDDAVLSEEGVDDKARLAADRVWIVDPLDGTREYGEEGRSDWAVHIALWVRGQGLTAAAVALPAAGDPLATLLYAEGASRRGRRTREPSRRRQPQPGARVGRAPSPQTARRRRPSRWGRPAPRSRPSSAARPRSTCTRGGQYEWDSAAPVAVARAAGLWCSRLDGSPLAYNQADPYLPDLVVCRADLAERVLEAVAERA